MELVCIFFGNIWLLTKGAWGYALIIFISLVLTSTTNIYLIIILGWAIITGFRGTWIMYNVKLKNKQMPKSFF